jgi:hypothetical protein
MTIESNDSGMVREFRAFRDDSDRTVTVAAPGWPTPSLGGRIPSLTRSAQVTNTRFEPATGPSRRYPSPRAARAATAPALTTGAHTPQET